MVMITLSIGLAVILLIALITGLRNNDEYEMGIEIVAPGNTAFEVGITNRHYVTTDGSVEQEIRIGFFFITFFICFFRNDA